MSIKNYSINLITAKVNQGNPSPIFEQLVAELSAKDSNGADNLGTSTSLSPLIEKAWEIYKKEESTNADQKTILLVESNNCDDIEAVRKSITNIAFDSSQRS